MGPEIIKIIYGKIRVESKESIKARTGRSPDFGDAFVDRDGRNH
jgi:hypothetical protein